MKFESLRYFHVTQQCGSIRKAADRLHIAPSAISRQIAILERSLKLKLFERNSSGVMPTAAGRLLAHHTRSIFRDIGRAQSAIDDLRGLRVSEITIYAMEGLVCDFLPSLLSTFHARFPGIRFNFVLAPTDRIIEAVVQGRRRHLIQRPIASRNHRRGPLRGRFNTAISDWSPNSLWQDSRTNRLREGHVSQHVSLGAVEERSELGYRSSRAFQ